MKKNYILILVMSMFALLANAQVTVDILVQDNFVVCEDEQEVYLVLNNNTTKTLTDIEITLPLQNFMEYTGFSGSNVNEVDVSDISEPILGLLPDTILAGQTDTIKVKLKIVCGYIDALVSAFPNINLSMKYKLNGLNEPTYVTDANSQGNTFDADRPEVLFAISPANQTVVPMRDSINLTFTIEQSDPDAPLTRAYGETNHYSRFSPIRFTIPGYGSINPTLFGTTREFFIIDTNVIKTQGDMDIYLEPGEIITINAVYFSNVVVDPSSYFFNFGAGFSCADNTLSSSGFCVPASSPYNPEPTDFTTPNERANSYMFYEDITGAGCPGALDTTTYVIYNLHGTESAVGSRAMYDFSFWKRKTNLQLDFFNNDNWQLMGLLFDGGNYVDLSDTTDMTRTTDTDSFSFATSDFDGAGGFSDMDGDGVFDDIAIADTVRVRMVVLRKNAPVTAGTPGGLDLAYHYIGIYTYQTQFGGRDGSESWGETDYPASFSGDNASSCQGSPGLFENDLIGTENISFTRNSSDNRFVSPEVTVNTQSTIRTRMFGSVGRVAIGDSVEYGLHIVGLPGITFNNLSGFTHVDNGDGTATYTKSIASTDECSALGATWRNFHNFPYTVTCDYYPLNGGDFCALSNDTLSFELYYFVKRVGPKSCGIEDTVVIDNSETVNVLLSSPTQCPVAYSNVVASSYKMYRTNYGWTDPTMTVPADVNTVGASNRFIMGDTMRTALPGKVFTNTHDTVVINISLGVGGRNGSDPVEKFDAFSLIDGSLNVIRGGATTTVMPVLQGTTLNGDSSELIYQLYYVAPGIGGFQPNDSLDFDGEWFIKDGRWDSRTMTTKGYYSYKDGSDLTQCVVYSQVVYVWRPVVGLTLSSMQNTSEDLRCSRFAIQYMLGFTTHTSLGLIQNINEYRQLGVFDTVRLTMPPNIAMRFNDTLFVGLYEGGQVMLTLLNGVDFSYDEATREVTIYNQIGDYPLNSQAQSHNGNYSSFFGYHFYVPVQPECVISGSSPSLRGADAQVYGDYFQANGAFTILDSFGEYTNTTRADGTFHQSSTSQSNKVTTNSNGAYVASTLTTEIHSNQSTFENGGTTTSLSKYNAWGATTSVPYATSLNSTSSSFTEYADYTGGTFQISYTITGRPPLDYNYFVFEDYNNTLNVTSVTSGGTSYNVFSLANDSIKAIRIPGLLAGSSYTFDFEIDYSSCTGTNIPYYFWSSCKDTIPQGVNHGCTKQSPANLTLSPKKATLTLDIVEQPMPPVPLCDTLNYKLRVLNTNIGSASEVKFETYTSLSGGVSIESTSTVVYRGVTYPLPAGVFSAPNLYTYDLTEIMHQYTDSVFTESDSFILNLKILTECGFVSGSFNAFGISGTQKCGSDLPDVTIELSEGNDLIGAVKSYDAIIEATQVPTFNVCSYNNRLDIEIENDGNGIMGDLSDSTKLSDTLRIFFPSEFNVDISSSFTLGSNHPSNNTTPLIETIPGGTFYSWGMPVGVQEGEIILFDLSYSVDIDSVDCGTENFINIEVFNYQTLSCNGTACPTPVLNGQANILVDFEKAQLDLLSTSESAVNCSDEIEFSVDVQNSSSIDVLSGVTVQIYADLDFTGSLTGADQLMQTGTIDTILSSTTETIDFSVSSNIIPGVNVCNIIYVLSEDSNCVCSGTTLADEIEIDFLSDTIFSCSLDPFELNPGCNIPSYSYNWSTTSPNATISNSNTSNPTFTGTALGIYSVQVEVTRGSCTSIEEAYVMLRGLPSVTVSNDTTICDGDIITLTATGGSKYLWSNSDTTSTITVNPNSSLVYTVNIEDIYGCSKDTSVSVTVNPIPNAVFTNSNTAMCLNDLARNLTATPSGGIFDGPGVSGTGFNPELAGVGIHEIKYIVSNTFSCYDTAFQEIEVLALTDINFINNDTTLCISPSIYSLFASLPGATFQGPGVSGSSFNTNLAGIGNHILITSYLNSDGCTSYDSITVQVVETPVISEVSSSDPTTCIPGNEGTITIDGLTSGVNYNIDTNGVSYLISATGSTYELTGLQARTYSITVETEFDCISNTISITLNPPTNPSAPSASSNSSVCVGEDLELMASFVAGGTYLWTGPGISSPSNTLQNPIINNVSLSDAGTYSVMVTVGGCESIVDQTIVVVDEADSVWVTSTVDPSSCGANDGQISISGLAAGNYTVLGNITPTTFSTATGNHTFLNLVAGAYSFSILDANGCSGNILNVSLVDPSAPNAPIASSNDTIVCEGTNVQLNATHLSAGIGTTYTWTGPNGFMSTQQNPLLTGTNINMSGTYCVTVTLSGCTSPATCLDITINEIPVISVANNQNPSTCNPGNDGTITIDGLTNGTDYYIDTNGVVFSITANSNLYQISSLSAGTYLINVETADSCKSNSVSVTLTEPTTPAAPTLTNDGPVCEGDDVQLTASAVIGGTYAWSGPNGFMSTDQNPLLSSVTAADGGIYSCIVTVAGCESTSAQTTVVVNATNSISITSVTDPTSCGSSSDGTITINGLSTGNYIVYGGLPSPISVSGSSHTFSGIRSRRIYNKFREWRWMYQ